MRPFRLHNPTTVAEAAVLLQRCDNAAIYAGGTELLLVMKQGFLHYHHLVDVKGITALHRLEVAGGSLHIGGAVTHARVEKDATVRRHLPILTEVERQVANVRVRNTGTLGGNLCFAEPHSDIGALALLLEGKVHLTSGSSPRVLTIDEFFRGPYETALQPGEMLERIELPLPAAGTGSGYNRFKLHERPSAVAGVRLAFDAGGEQVAAAHVVVGCVGPIPVRVPAAEQILRGCGRRHLFEAAVEAARAAAKAVEIIPDLSGSEQYKRHLTGVLVLRSVQQAGAQPQREGVSA